MSVTDIIMQANMGEIAPPTHGCRQYKGYSRPRTLTAALLPKVYDFPSSVTTAEWNLPPAPAKLLTVSERYVLFR